MGRLMAHFYDRIMAGSEAACLSAWRSELLADVGGRVLEVGAGTGVNLPLYPPTVRQIVMSEPDPFMRSQLESRLTFESSIPVDVSDGSLESLPFPDGEFDVVTCMLVLCSVPDLTGAIDEMRRVLTPGGRLVFMEHVAADNRPDRLKWQRRLEPLWKRISGNCHLTRRTERAIVDGGFHIDRIKRESMRKAVPVARPTIRGVAVRRSR